MNKLLVIILVLGVGAGLSCAQDIEVTRSKRGILGLKLGYGIGSKAGYKIGSKVGFTIGVATAKLENAAHALDHGFASGYASGYTYDGFNDHQHHHHVDLDHLHGPVFHEHIQTVAVPEPYPVPVIKKVAVPIPVKVPVIVKEPPVVIKEHHYHYPQGDYQKDRYVGYGGQYDSYGNIRESFSDHHDDSYGNSDYKPYGHY